MPFSNKPFAAAITVGVLAAVSVPTRSARAAEPDDVSVDDLRRQIVQLQGRLDAMERQQQSRQAADAAEVRQTVTDVLDDADQRSRLLTGSGELQAGYDNGFFIRSGDGNFVFKPGVNFQFRYILNHDESSKVDTEDGFEVRRIRPYFRGNLFSPKLTYFFQWDTNRDGGDLTLLDAQVQYAFADNWSVKFGQFKESVFHEKDVSIFAQLAVERSLVDALIGGNQTDRVQGVSLTYGGTDGTNLRAEGAFTDGANSKNTNFQDTPTNPWDFGFAGRVEYKLFGDWGDYQKEFTARSTKNDLLVIGAGGDFSQAGDADQALYVVDVQYKTASHWTLFGALHGRTLDTDAGDSFSWAAVGQVGYAVNPQWEPYLRYDVIRFAEAGVGGDVFNEVTVGVNYYLGENGSAGQRAKFSLDLLYLPDGAPSDQTGYGVLASDDDEFILRAQFQLLL